MLINLTFWWAVVMSALKGLGWIQCSWWLVLGPLPIAAVITIVALMYISLLWGGSIKFWRCGK